jgi:hypothetical protein
VAFASIMLSLVFNYHDSEISYHDIVRAVLAFTLTSFNF